MQTSNLSTKFINSSNRKILKSHKIKLPKEFYPYDEDDEEYNHIKDVHFSYSNNMMTILTSTAAILVSNPLSETPIFCDPFSIDINCSSDSQLYFKTKISDQNGIQQLFLLSKLDKYYSDRDGNQLQKYTYLVEIECSKDEKDDSAMLCGLTCVASRKCL